MKIILQYLALSLLFCSLALAENTGSITGRVIDKTSKQPLPGANVQIDGTSSGASTDANGRFILAELVEDVYKLRISFIGYQTFIETDVRVVRNKSTYVQDIELAESAVEGETVVITSGFAEEDDEAPVSNFTFAREQIIRTPGASGDILRAIESMPGVSTSGGEFSAFSVRGGTPKENLILVDNIPFSKLTHFIGGFTEEQDAQGGRFSIFAPGTVEEANFQGGGFSAVNGGKFSSLLSLTIREGNFESPTVDARYDLIGWEVNYNGPTYLQENTSLYLSARHQDFERILDITGQKDLGQPSYTDIILKTTTRINSNHKVTVLGIYAPEKFNRDTRHVLESDDFAETNLGSFEESMGMVGINWRFLTGKSSFWKNTFYGGRRDQTGLVGDATALVNQPSSRGDFKTKDIFDISEVQDEYGLRSAFTFLPGNHSSITVGIDVKQERYDYSLVQNGLDTLYSFDADDFRPDPSQKFLIRTPEQVNYDFDQEQLFFDSYVQTSFRPIVPLTVNFGLRHEYNGFNEDHNFSPRASLSYHLSDQTRLSLASGLYYQAPEFPLLGADPRNFNLKSQRSIHAIAGMTHYLKDNLKLFAEIYYKDLDDLVVRQDRTTGLRTNAGDGWASGIDLALIRRFADKFYGQINYSYSQSKRNDNDGLGEYNSDFNQPHIFSILGGYEFNKEWTIAAKWRYATGRPTDSFIVHADVFGDPAFRRYAKEITGNNNDRLSDFHTFNIRVDYRKQIGPLAIVSYLDIVNLYNNTNVNEDRFLPVIGETSEEGFGILPTFGLKFEY